MPRERAKSAVRESGGLQPGRDFRGPNAFGEHDLVGFDAPRGDAVENRSGRPARRDFVFARSQVARVPAETAQQAERASVLDQPRPFEIARDLGQPLSPFDQEELGRFVASRLCGFEGLVGEVADPEGERGPGREEPERKAQLHESSPPASAARSRSAVLR